jgi:glycosyltransferase involved in cell wall biosynthesis
VSANANHCAALIPCRNEAGTIADVVRGARMHLDTVIVVDDASRDDTASRALAAGAVVLRQDEHRGKGAALALGWKEADCRGFRWVLHLDGDGQHSTDDIPRFLSASTEQTTLWIGNRFDNPAAIPWGRRVVNRWMSRQVSQLAGTSIPDSQCGYRLMHLPTLMSLSLHTQHFEIESEMCVAFARAGKQIGFVPVEVRYGAEVSKISPLRDAIRWCRWYASVRRGQKTVTS